MKVKKTQQELILEALKKGEVLTQLEATNRFLCTRLGARIYDLKQEGYPIRSKMIKDQRTGKTFAGYFIPMKDENGQYTLGL